jgi:hypothetical protein
MRDLKASDEGLRGWIVRCLALFLVAGFAAEAKSGDKLSELMKLSSFDAVFDHLGDQLKAGAKQRLPDGPLSAADKDKVLAGLDPAAEKAFAPEMLKREFQHALNGKLTEADLDRILAFHKTPLGVRLTGLAKAAQTADRHARIAKMAGELLEWLKNEPERAAVLTEMDSSLRLTEFATDVAFNVGRAIAIGMVAADEKTMVLTPEAIEAIDSALQKMRPSMTAQIKAMILLSLAYTYREMSIEELRQYLVFATSPVGKRYHDAAVSAINKVLVNAGGEFGHALMRELGKERT